MNKVVRPLISRDSRVSARDSFYRQVLSNTTHDKFCQKDSRVDKTEKGGSGVDKAAFWVVEWIKLLSRQWNPESLHCRRVLFWGKVL